MDNDKTIFDGHTNYIPPKSFWKKPIVWVLGGGLALIVLVAIVGNVLG